ncbi:hypothetical protein B296_00043802 [Ensete ventricosum]|uniref:Uncharacterized protein n=1 Tax=Ensete ventricosum TaxID=4639 RepID=A0A426ZDF0_ENSVE|nr:hypothetical protein B296_00043802 [Ensete ventricosum]
MPYLKHSGQVDSQMQIMGSILQPNISGMIQLSRGEAYLPHDKGNGAGSNKLISGRSSFPAVDYNRMTTSAQVSRFFGSFPALRNKWPQSAEPGQFLAGQFDRNHNTLCGSRCSHAY